MARSIWSGSISFGLVNVTVKMHTAVRHKDVRFHQLHAEDGVRIQQRRVCPADGQEVTFDQLTKGYEISPGRYVVITPDELDALDPESSHAIDIEDFVSLEEIDPLYLDTSYFLVPDSASAKAYRLLLDAMSTTTRVGIGRIVLRTKQYLCAIRPLGDALVLSTMNFSDEVVDMGELEGLPDATPATDREMDIARQLIDAMTADFEPSRYHDTYRDAVMELIEAKAAGQEITTAEAPEERAPVVDLMAALEASLTATRSGGSEELDAQNESTGS
ncbi:MAG: Ku protein [Acidimicrobiales bacterium]